MLQQLTPPLLLACPPSVLIVEDDETLAEMFVTILSEEHYSSFSPHNISHPRYHVTASAEGALAFLAIASPLPSLVILDFALLGNRTGGDVLIAMRADPCMAQVPVILVSASRGGERPGVALAVKLADRTVYKPFEVEEFLAAVHAVCPSLRATQRKGSEEQPQ